MCIKPLVSLIAICSLTLSSPVQVGAQQAQPSQSSSASPSLKGFVLEEGTPIKLKLNRNVSSEDAHVGDSVDFEVVEEIDVNGITVVPKGSLALATVTQAQAKRRMGRGGKLDMNIDSVRLADGEKAALRAVKASSGGSHTGAMTAGIVATGLLIWPAAPFFLFMHGKDVTIPKGAELTAYVNGDMKLEISRFQSAPATQQVATPTAPTPAVVAAPATSAGSAKVQVESAPAGADIEVDGSFVGSTPSDVQVPDGEHTITVKKTGFKSWERKMKISGASNVHLNAELEKAPAQ